MSLTNIETNKNGKLIFTFVNSPGSYSHDDLPVPIRINNYKKKNRKVFIRRKVSRTEPYNENKTGKLLLLRKRKDSYDDSERGCGLSRWCSKRRAYKEIEEEHKKREKQAKEWQKWKFQEAELVRKAQKEDERLKREAEYVRQLAEIEQQKRELIKKSSNTYYPFPAKKRTSPKDSFKKDLPTDPYYPKRIKLSDDDYVIEKSRKLQKREAKKKQKEERKAQKRLRKKEYVQQRDPYPEVAQHSKCSKIRTCLNNFCGSTKKKPLKPYTDTTDYSKPETSKKYKKEIPYTDPYEKYYEKSNKETPYTDPYEKYYEKSKKATPYTGTYDKYYDKPKKEKPYDEKYYDKYKTDTPRNIDPYQEYYDKPKKETPSTDPYQAYYDTTCDTSKCKKKRKESPSDGELYEQYYKLYGSKLKYGKKRKDSDKIVDKRTERGKYSRMFVNCFYRTCCECYCWFSAFVLLGVAIIMVI